MRSPRCFGEPILPGDKWPLRHREMDLDCVSRVEGKGIASTMKGPWERAIHTDKETGGVRKRFWSCQKIHLQISHGSC